MKVNGVFQSIEKHTLFELPNICDDIKVFNGRL